MTKIAAIERWLVKQTLSEAILNLPVGLICLGASLMVVAFSTAIACFIGLVLFLTIAAFARSAFDLQLRNPLLFCEIFCAAFLIWLFVSHYRRNAEYFRLSRFRNARVHVSDAGFARALNILFSRPRDVDGIFQQLIYTGPQWMTSAISMFYKSVTLLKMDIESCAKILVIVLNKGSRVSFTELSQLVPECNSVKIFPQLRDIAGVVFLESEPSGISLTSDLRAGLSRVLGVKMKPEPQPKFYRQTKSAPPPRPPPQPIVEEDSPGPHKILGVSRSASLAQIKAAYRRQIKQCHPDRFATLNKDWQQMAEQRSKIINAAYATLTNQANHRTRI
ncbi:MAG: J domain-containing protein [Verrucomicrobiota bacterium]